MKLSAKNYAGREDEQAAADMLDLTIPGARSPTTKRELKEYEKRVGLGVPLAVQDKFFSWMEEEGDWKRGDKARIAATASAVSNEYDRFLMRMAYADDRRSITQRPTNQTRDNLKKVAAWGSSEPGFAQARSAALAMIRDIANNGLGHGPVTYDEVLWGVVLGVEERARALGFQVRASGYLPGIDALRDEFNLPRLGRTRK